MTDGGSTRCHKLSVVIPVYGGEHTLRPVVEELARQSEATTPAGVSYRISEVLLVFDHGHDRSDVVMRELAATYPFVRTV